MDWFDRVIIILVFWFFCSLSFALGWWARSKLIANLRRHIMKETI